MPTTEEMGEQFANFMTNTFQIPAEWFLFPQIIFYFIIPMAGLIAMWYTLLDKRIKIFRTNSFVNFVIAVIISMISSSVIVTFSPTTILAISFGGIITFWRRFSIITTIFALLAAGIVFFFYPTLISWVPTLA